MVISRTKPYNEQKVFCMEGTIHGWTGRERIITQTVDQPAGLIDLNGDITPLKPVTQEQRAILEKHLRESPERKKARQEYRQTQIDAYKATLPPDITPLEFFKLQQNSPASPLAKIEADVEAKFGPFLLTELSTRTRQFSVEERSVYLQSFPGKFYEIEYTTAAGHRAAAHMIDIVFMRAWLEHPNFHMIK